MNLNFKRLKTEALVWKHFSRHKDAIFLSMNREIRIAVLSVATLTFACPQSSTAKMSMSHNDTAGETAATPSDAASAEDWPIDISELQQGDLLFCIASPSRDGVAAAIADVTEGIDLQRVIHVAIVCRQNNGRTYALEASSEHGVWLNPIDSFFVGNNRDAAYGTPSVIVGRLKDRSQAAESVKRALAYIGRPYDHLYSPSDSAIYCSELVQLSYRDSQGQPIFPLQPMSFHDKSGKITDFWKKYYARWDMEVPEGEPGTNPGGISRSDKIRIIGKICTLQETEVVGSLAPLPASKAVRLVQIITRKEIEASSANSVNDLLKLAAGVDVRQRGGFGIQTDIGVNGGTEDQLTVLLNGININNPNTGHHTVDLPVGVDDIERIEIIEGGASRIYGSQAFAGAINIVTRSANKSSAGAHLQGGSYGTLGANAHIALKSSLFANRVSGGYQRSDGASGNDDFNKGNAYWNGKYTGRLFDATVQAGFSTMNYGANTFYGTGSDSQYEEGRRYLVAAQGAYKGKVAVAMQAYWNRSLDHYVWWRDRPADYQNFHQTNVYGTNLNAHTTWALGKTSAGVELRRENILSTRLGNEIEDYEQPKYKVPGHDEHYRYKDGRTNFGLYLEHDVILNRATISAGMLANHNSSIDEGKSLGINSLKLYPGIDISWRITDGLKLFASFNQSLRTPTYTDLYYNGPGLLGNKQLKPEKSTDWHIGVSHLTTLVNAHVKGYYRHGTDMIDWVKYSGSDVYTTANSDIDNIGAEALLALNLANKYGKDALIQQVTMSYCYNYMHRRDKQQEANYASPLTFLRHKLAVSLNHRIVDRLSAQWQFTLKNREGEFDNATTGNRQTYGSFALLDLKLQWTAPRYTLYVQANNLTDHPYYDFANIRQPGLWMMGGVKISTNL